MKPRINLILAVCTFALIAPAPAHAQFGKLKEKVKARVEKKIEEKVDCTLDKYFDRKECKDARVKAAADSARVKSSQPARDVANESAEPAPPEAAAPKVGEGAWSNYDFVPGDKILFAEDFSTDRVGNFPKRLELEEGTFEVVEWQNRRWLRGMSNGQFIINLPQTLPERWTMEFEVTIPWGGLTVGTSDKLYERSNFVQHIHLAGTSVEVQNAGKNGQGGKGVQIDPRPLFPNMYPANGPKLSKPIHVRVQADGNYMKVYLEEHRVANLPNMGRWEGNQIRFHFRKNWGGPESDPLLTGISINAGGRELYDALMANGRLAVQGIYFDVGSDRIRPESSGTLSEIAEMLKEHAELKLMVEGHTDNVGQPAANKTLSEARAAAVVAQLVGKGIDPSRLKSAGYGDTKPAAPNDGPENRQKNRRVELVKT